MRLIVGLGNPGPEYAQSPHNLGFAVIKRLVEQSRIRTCQRRSRARLWRGRLDQTEVLLVQPQTYMNASGAAVDELVRTEGVTPADLIVVSDEVALPWGTLRIRERGSAGGHKGLDSVIAALGTSEFLRVRLGVRPAAGSPGDLTEYVLAPMNDQERRLAAEMVAEAAEAIRAILREGPGRAMARFNRRAAAPPSEPGAPGT